MKEIPLAVSVIIMLVLPALSLAGDCGDVDNSGAVNILDVTFMINYLYKGGPAPDPIESADVNNDDVINILDITYLINYLYLNGPGPLCCKTGTVTDIDGNVYQTVKIGEQWWMAENLKTTHYRNGDPIPHETDPYEWPYLIEGAYCEYDNNDGIVTVYGRLYNWFAVADSRSIAPEGWHVPTDTEWKQLEIYLGMSQTEADTVDFRGSDEGGKLKDAGTAHWYAPNTGATNISCFSALAGGSCKDHCFLNIGLCSGFWSSSLYLGDRSWSRYLTFDSSSVYRHYRHNHYGLSVRCIVD